MKSVRVEISCVEDHLYDGIFAAKKLCEALKFTSIELKIFKDVNRDPEKGHAWLTVNNTSEPTDLAKIYHLSKKVAELTQDLVKPNIKG